MSRVRRPIFPNQYYFITSATFRRRRWFARPRFAKVLIDQWKHYERVYKFSIDAYCILPDHYHVVLNVGRDKTISQILHAVHSYTSTSLNRQIGNISKTRIWEGNSWDEVIRDEEMYWQKVAYTLFNPVREGIVKEPLEPFQFSNLADWLKGEGEEFIMDLFSGYKRWFE